MGFSHDLPAADCPPGSLLGPPLTAMAATAAQSPLWEDPLMQIDPIDRSFNDFLQVEFSRSAL
jgi:hypothetical protein